MKSIQIRKALLSVVLIAMAMSGIQKEAAAVADGNGTCSATEIANFDCANFGPGNAIEFRGALPSNQCPLSNATTTSCTLYFYLYTGTATNQVNVAIPTKLTKILNEASEIRCSQYLTGGGGAGEVDAGKRAHFPASSHLPAPAEIVNGLDQGLQRLRLGCVSRGDLNLNAVRRFLRLALELVAKRLHVLSATVEHFPSPPFVLAFQNTRTMRAREIISGNPSKT